MRIICDTLVLGSGVAGLTFALEAAKRGSVLIATKRAATDSASAWAQGGIAAVQDPEDSFAAHVADTIAAGAGLADPEVVERVVREGPARVRELTELGARFSPAAATHAAPTSANPTSARPVVPSDSTARAAVGAGRDGQAAPGTAAPGARETPPGGETPPLDLTREGGHSARRVVHADDATGVEVQRVLLEATEKEEQIRLLEGHMAVELIEGSRFGGERQVLGAYLLDEGTGEVVTCLARTTVLATGGAGKVYVFTSNPDVATGDGVAMAYRAGAEIANLEFFQFHPTCLFHREARTFLISEAMRGEGGVLRLADGTAFMDSHHPQGDLAPRDVVARAIDYEMKRTGDACVYLDMSSRDPEWLRTRFRNIHAECLRFGIDLTSEWVPVVPAAHYMCGGVSVDMEGRTTIPGLLAVGEVAHTGLHGANRLASNSLLEGLVFGHRAAETLAPAEGAPPWEGVDVPDWDPGEAVPPDEVIVVTHMWSEIRRLMWDYVGIVRSERRLLRATRRIRLIQEEIKEYYWQYLVTRDLIELRNLADVAELIIASASARRESRGLHFTLDHPERDPALDLTDTVMRRGAEIRFRRR